LNAFLVFLDESGFLMAPLLRRSWSPCGNTPIVRHRTRSHKKVSAIAALVVSPCKSNVRLYFRLHPDENIATAQVRHFLQNLHRHIQGPVVLIWDRHKAHRSRKTTSLLKSWADFHSVLLPPYAPELNPVEGVWGYLKLNPLANLACLQLDELHRCAHRHSRSIQRNPDLLRAFVEHSALPLRLK
jgi:transposase